MNTEKEMEKNFTIALQKHKEGNIEIAEKLYKKIIQKNPNHFNSFYGHNLRSCHSSLFFG